MTLLLVRHGETDWNLEPARCQGWAAVGLNPRGREQARELGRSLAGRGVARVVTSHLRRARETATLIRELLPGEPPLVVDPRLAETNRGEWEGRLFEDIMAEEPDAWRAYREQPAGFRFPGGESLAEQQHRVLACLRDCARLEGVSLLVTHGGCMRLVRCFLAGQGPALFHATGAHNGEVMELGGGGELVARIEEFLAAARLPLGGGPGA